MPKAHKKKQNNVDILDTELEFSIARLWHYLNVNKNVPIQELEEHYEEILTEGLRELLPPDSVARLGIKMTIGKLQRKGKIQILRDVRTNEKRVCLTHDRIFKNKWLSGLKVSPNAL